MVARVAIALSTEELVKGLPLRSQHGHAHLEAAIRKQNVGDT